MDYTEATNDGACLCPARQPLLLMSATRCRLRPFVQARCIHEPWRRQRRCIRPPEWTTAIVGGHRERSSRATLLAIVSTAQQKACACGLRRYCFSRTCVESVYTPQLATVVSLLGVTLRTLKSASFRVRSKGERVRFSQCRNVVEALHVCEHRNTKSLRNSRAVAYRRIHTRLTFLRPQDTEQMGPPIAFETARHGWLHSQCIRSAGAFQFVLLMSSPSDNIVVGPKD